MGRGARASSSAHLEACLINVLIVIVLVFVWLWLRPRLSLALGTALCFCFMRFCLWVAAALSVLRVQGHELDIKCTVSGALRMPHQCKVPQGPALVQLLYKLLWA